MADDNDDLYLIGSFFHTLGDQLQEHLEGLDRQTDAAQIVLAASIIATSIGSAVNIVAAEDEDGNTD